MTDKQIIIDGVDVSGCKYFCLNQTGNNCLNHNQGFSMNCNNNNCYYKQLKRKEQECEELKAKIEYVFFDVSPNFDYFCDICVAKDKCNKNCCFEKNKGVNL